MKPRHIILLALALEMSGCRAGHGPMELPQASIPVDDAGAEEGAGPIEWRSTMLEAVRDSRQHDKPLLIFFFSEACPHCRLMEKGAWTDPQVTQYVNEE